MTSKSERELQNEIAYLTSLIEAHKKVSKTVQSRPNLPPNPKHSRGNKFKWTASVPSQGKHVPSKAAAPPPLLPSTSSQQLLSQEHSLIHTVSVSTAPRTHAAAAQPVPTRTPPGAPSSHSHSYRYSNQLPLHHHGNPHRSHGNPRQCPGNRHGSHTKWSNLVYAPPRAKSASSGYHSTSSNPSLPGKESKSSARSSKVEDGSRVQLNTAKPLPPSTAVSSLPLHCDLSADGRNTRQKDKKKSTASTHKAVSPLLSVCSGSATSTTSTTSTARSATSTTSTTSTARSATTTTSTTSTARSATTTTSTTSTARSATSTTSTTSTARSATVTPHSIAPRGAQTSLLKWRRELTTEDRSNARTHSRLPEPAVGGTVTATTVPGGPPSKNTATPTFRYPRPHGNRRRLNSAGSANSTRYKWRRRTSGSKKTAPLKSPILKSPSLRVKPPTLPWVVHNRYKLTRASIVHKYSKILHRQRHSSSHMTNRLGRSSGRRTPTQALHKKSSRSTNKVWLASDSSDAKPTTAVLLPPRRLSGHELKTRQGNRQWVSKRVRRSVHFSQPSSSSAALSTASSSAAVTASMPPLGTPVRHTGPASKVATLFRHPARRLSGYELKTRHGNKQWVSKRVRRSLQLVPANYSRAAAVFGAGAPVQRRKGRVGGRGLFNQLVSLSGQKFVVDSGGHRMKRVLSFSSSSTSSPLFPRPRLRSRGRSTAESSHSAVKHYLASRAVQRSRVHVWTAKQRKKETKQYCIFYNRFGKCNKGNTCPYIHDPDKIAVCTKFLRGTCDKTDGSCVFSHVISKDKMPTCSFFLRGVCTRDVCPYLHVNVGRHAAVCLDFARGYCPNGEQCTKQHVVDCPDFSTGGSCPRGAKCPLRHRKRTKPSSHIAPRPPSSLQHVPPTKTPLAFRRLQRRLVPESGPVRPRFGHWVVKADADDDNEVSSCDQVKESCDAGHQVHYSPLDPNFPAPDFLSL